MREISRGQVNNVKEWLSLYPDNERELDNQYERLIRIETRLEAFGAVELTDMPKSRDVSSNDRLADLMCKKIELEEDIKRLREIQSKEIVRIETVLKGIQGADNRMVIRMRYIDGERWENVTRAMFGQDEEFDDKAESYLRRVFKTHGEALSEMTRFMVDKNEYKDIVNALDD